MTSDSRRLAKFALLPPLLAVGALAAGAYGAVHNQVSYTVSPDYFHAFKFEQFEFPPEWRNRAGAALVGWLASWWMGVLVGLPLLIAAYFTSSDPRRLIVRSLVAYAIVIATALSVGLGALAVAAATIDADSLPPYWYPAGVDEVAFARAGTMHNFSYLGGFLGLFTGCGYLIATRDRPPVDPSIERRAPVEVLTRVLASLLMLAVGMLVAGMFGAIHNYISYSVSPDFFHAFVFGLVPVPADLDDRWGAVALGFESSCWLGLLMGCVLLPISYAQTPEVGRFTRRVFRAYVVVIATSVGLGLASLAVSHVLISPDKLPQWSFPPGVDKVAFARAGTMHMITGFAGILGMTLAIVYLYLSPDAVRHLRARTDSLAPSASDDESATK